MKIDIFNAEEKYDILYTDPPWQQGRGGKKAARPNSTGTTVPYETMDVPGIMELHRYVTNELMNEKAQCIHVDDRQVPAANRGNHEPAWI